MQQVCTMQFYGITLGRVTHKIVKYLLLAVNLVPRSLVASPTGDLRYTKGKTLAKGFKNS